ncbi:helix-turn-helix domain-containing protein [Pseudothermotoga thermarum]|uniref:helix-turn-helix domain-containing protein n=1 Tax=Pseudothermotoga thermarum TaxID=119394 RepID=UPI00031B7802|nr:helix-turn-helix transcriptional regulator [Pseudothermotoga thermarum]
MYQTVEIMLSKGKKVQKTLEAQEKLALFSQLDLSTSMYENTLELRNCIRSLCSNISELSRRTGISRSNLSKLLNGKFKSIKGGTIFKILPYVNKETILTFKPFLCEKIKSQIDGLFRETFEYLHNMDSVERKKLLLATYSAQLEGTKGINLLTVMNKDFQKADGTNLLLIRFICDAFEAHPYIEARKNLVKNVFERMSKDKFEKFLQRYMELEEKDRKLLNKFLRNYAKYENTRFSIALQDSEVLKAFSVEYSLKPQALCAAYWCEEDGRIRRKLNRILKHMVEV